MCDGLRTLQAPVDMIEARQSPFFVSEAEGFTMLQEEGRHMLAQGYGKIINTASLNTVVVLHPEKQVAYNASKAAVAKITQTLGTEWADRGLNVNCISPGIVNTALVQVRYVQILQAVCLAVSCMHMHHRAYTLNNRPAPCRKQRIVSWTCGCHRYQQADLQRSLICKQP